MSDQTPDGPAEGQHVVLRTMNMMSRNRAVVQALAFRTGRSMNAALAALAEYGLRRHEKAGQSVDIEIIRGVGEFQETQLCLIIDRAFDERVRRFSAEHSPDLRLELVLRLLVEDEVNRRFAIGGWPHLWSPEACDELFPPPAKIDPRYPTGRPPREE